MTMTPERAREIAHEIKDETLGPAAHNGSLYETCGDKDPFCDLRDIIETAILSACSEERAYLMELVCAGCGTPHGSKPTAVGCLTYQECTRAEFERQRRGK